MVTIGMIEDDPKIRGNFQDYFKYDSQYKLSFSYHSLEHFLSEGQMHVEEPYITFLDISLPGISGLEAIPILKKSMPNTQLVVLSGNSDPDVVWNAITKGAKGYLLKPFSLGNIKANIQLVKNGGALLSPEIAHILIDRLGVEKPQKTYRLKFLTKREQDVLEQLLKGFTYKEIANVLSLSVTTINDHIKNIYKKMNVNSKAELLTVFLR